MTEQNGKMLSIQSEELVVLFRRASRLMARASHRRDHSHHAQEHVLSIIRQYGSINQSDLLEILDVRSSSLSEVLGKLERNGLIARERNEQDKRSFVISAIDHEASRETGPHSSSEENVDFLFACLGDEEREQLTGILNKIILSMENDPLCQDAGCACHGHGGGLHGHHGREAHAFGRGPRQCGQHRHGLHLGRKDGDA